ncbi:uncharacterized protein EV422DRAFT_566639 [Fimicolochytrium jonesii]|uniref:uncharacterized protein n=1 Tax=Fimicolochytrium jonesii TaxID=1396493 RepID=UPI0022FE334A|nr:uncharacterized protein EV422DRAFT_566639 [Fimicolochytrium jonesii]KAI8822203.1 hypothetical protein EV422DRAFT_566639 [Fimicolochytrium jonesii]
MHTFITVLFLVLASIIGSVFAQQRWNETGNLVGYGASGQPLYRATQLPDMSQYSRPVTLARTETGQLQFAYYIENNTYLRFMTMMTGFKLGHAFMGLGFGDSMLIADFVITHLGPDGSTVESHEHIHRMQYAPPWASENPEPWVIEPINGGLVNGTFFSEIRRPFDPPQRSRPHVALARGDVGDGQHVIWAYNVDSPKNDWGGNFEYHNPNPGSKTGLPSEIGQTHGKMLVNFDRRSIIYQAVPNPAGRLAHGIMMFTAALVIFPAGAFYSRYMRFIPRWIWVHIALQSIGYITLLAGLVTMVLTIRTFRVHPHSILGLVLIGLLTAQVFFGFSNRSLLRTDLPRTPRRTMVKWFHRLLGTALILGAVVQVYLGLRILYPLEEPRGDAFWIVYFVVIGFWVAVFVCTQIGRRAFFVIKDRPYAAVPTEEGGKFREPPGIVELNRRQGGRLYPNLEAYDWKALDNEIRHGRLLVVANSRYIYDTSEWITSHPGGQSILLAVAGTDITSDYFHEGGYDAVEFTPAPPAPKQSSRRKKAPVPNMTATPDARLSISDIQGGEVEAYTMTAPAVLTQADWTKITRARRPHVHTKLAIMRLAHLLVGELTPAASSPDDPGSLYHFDPYEYRRYALTSKELLTDPTQNCAHQIYRLRFCLLYPFEPRTAAPDEILPGQCIELQVRVNGVPMARYYSPVTGTLSALEVWVKAYPTQGVSSFVCRERPGDRQFKIRGPFGPPLLDLISPSLKPESWIWGSILYVAGGTGITPFLQLCQYLFLPVGVPLKASSAYTPTMPDELTIRANDILVVTHHYLDGWAHGTNLDTNEDGVFPLPITVPRHGPHVKLVLLNCASFVGDLVGGEIIDAVLLSYPAQLEVHHCVAGGVPDGRGRFSGFAYTGHLTDRILREAVRGAASTSSPGMRSRDDHSHVQGKWSIVSGPASFNEFVYGKLVQMFGYRDKDIAVLSNSVADWRQEG